MHIFRPENYWRGSVEYVPWKLGDHEHDRGNLKKLQRDPDNGEGRRKGHDATASLARGDPSSFVALSKVDDMEGCRVEGAHVSNQVELDLELGAVVGQDQGGIISVRCASEGSTSLGPGSVETALHSVLDALRRVRAERLRFATRSSRAPSETNGK